MAIAFDVVTGRSTWEAFSSGKLEFTPALFLATNIGNALCIPLAMLLQWWIWGQPVRWLHSVAGVVRWRLLGRTAAVVVPLWLVYMGSRPSRSRSPRASPAPGTSPARASRC